MRTCFLTIVMIIALTGAVMAADSPISKGSLLIDGSIYYQSYSGDIWEDSDGNGVSSVSAGSVELGQFSVDISPAVGYFVADGICVGAQIGFQSISMGDNDKVNLFAIGPSVGYYGKINPSVADVKGSFYAYGRGYASFGSMGDEDDNSRSVTQFGGNLGLLYMVSGAIGADLSFKVQQDSWKDKGDPEAVTGMTMRLGLGMTAFIF